MASSALDLDVDAGAQIELHQGVERLLRGLENVQEPLVRADLELLPALLVDVRGAQDGELVDPGRERNGPRDASAGALRGLDDLPRALVEQLGVVRLEADSDLLCRHCLVDPSVAPSNPN